MRIKSLLLSIIISTVLLSCKKSNIDLLEGTYTGTFTSINESKTQIGTTTVIFKESNFSSTCNSNYIPAGGSGKYSVLKNTINFEDHNYWIAIIDGDMILNGDYDYSFDGKNLIISAKRGNNRYVEYKLIKQ